MESRRVAAILIVILAASCLILASILRGILREGSVLPDSAAEDLALTLREAGIEADPSLLSDKSGFRETASVYVLDSEDYDVTVASLLSGSRPSKTYATPDGGILLMENGARVEFGADFSFRYSADGSEVDAYRVFDLTPPAASLSEERIRRVTEIVTDFLEAGSRSFSFADRRGIDVRCVADTVWETDGVQYALCSRTVDGLRIAANRVVCALDGDTVSEAWGTWYFLTPAESYSAQLVDRLNILFNMKKEIGRAETPVTIESVTLCYSLWFLGDGEGFCLIPCWQVTTDTMGQYLFNALDGKFFTNN